MADTWRSVGLGVTFGNLKSMLDVFNATGSGRILRVYRAYQFNNGLSAVTGVLTTMRLYRSIASSGGTVITPVAHDSTNAALPAQVTSGFGRTVTDSDLFRQYVWSNDEPVVSGTTLDEWELLVPFAEIWNAGYADANIQPITCRENQGFHIKHQGSSAVGSNDFEIEFTNSAT